MKRQSRNAEKPAQAAPSARSPELYPRRVLLCMAGLTPAIITETLYALVVPPDVRSATREATQPRDRADLRPQPRPDPLLGPLSSAAADQGVWKPGRLRKEPQPFASFVPTEIHLITTVDGERAMLDGLLKPSEAWPLGVLAQLQSDYAEYFAGVQIDFGPQNVHVIRHADGTPVHDFATEDDNEATGNTILSVLRDFVADDECAIHASYAGGRKSMSAVLALSMSLLGRKQDRLSQVLIPRVFEVSSFLYPPPVPRMMNGFKDQPVSTADAHITLAILPLLRVFDGLGLKLRDPEISFESVIRLCEMALEKQVVIVKPSSRTIQIGHLACKLTASEMGFYTLMAERRLAGAVVPGDRQQRAGGVRFLGEKGAEKQQSSDDWVVGFDPADPIHRKARARFMEDVVPEGPQRLKPRVSQINTKLTDAFFTADIASLAMIVGPSGKGKGDGIYGLFNAPDLYVSA